MTSRGRDARGGGNKRGRIIPPPVFQYDPIYPNASQPFMGLLNLSSAQKKRWRNLESRKIQVTTFLHLQLLRDLGLEALVADLMSQAGLGTFLGKRADTYLRYTLEFLSTVEIGKGANANTIQVHIDDEVYRVSYEDLRGVLGVDQPRGSWLDVDGASCFFFTELTGLPCTKKYLRASSFSHPAWKLFYRGLAMTWLANGEPAQLNLAMVNLLRTGLRSYSVIPDWVDIFMKRCEAFAQTKKGNISIGGMISLIAAACIGDLKPEAIKLTGGTSLYSREWLIQYDKFARNPMGAGNFSLLFEYGDPRKTVTCMAGAAFPSGTQARQWRMPGVEDVMDHADEGDDEEEQEQEQGDQNEAEQNQGQQGSFDQWDVMRRFLEEQQQSQRAFLEEQERARQAREHSRWALEDVRFQEVQDRFEGVEDEVAILGARSRQIEAWAMQPEPRRYEPVSEDYLTMMQSRAAERAQRHSSRQLYYQGEGSTSRR